MIPVQTLKAAVLFLAGLAVAVWAVPQDTVATGYPKKPLTLVVAYSPGGAVDNIARTVAKYIEPHLGQRVVVQNKPGAGGEIGYRSLARARNDGYTLGMITSPPVLMLDRLRPGAGVGMENFEALAGLQRDPVVLAVNSSSPYETFDELLAASRERRINIAGDGPNSNNQLQLVVAEALLDVDFNFVPYSGSGPSITSLLGKQVEAAVPSASSATLYVLRGDLRVLAVFSPDRYEYLPDAPTILEASGIDVPDVGAAVRGIVLPAGVPAERKAVLAEALARLSADAAFLENARLTRLPLYFQDAEGLARYLDATSGLLETYMQRLGEDAEQ